MLLGRVIGTVWATRKDERLEGPKFHVVRELDLDYKPLPRLLIAVDTVQAEIGEPARDEWPEALGGGDAGTTRPSLRGPAQQRELINESQVIAARDTGGVLMIPPGAIVTPLARDAAERFNVELRSGVAPGTS